MGGNCDEDFGLAVDKKDFGTDCKWAFAFGRAGAQLVPVAVRVLNRDAAGQALVQRADGHLGRATDEIGDINGIGLVARDQPRDGTCRASHHRDGEQDSRRHRSDGRQRRPDDVGDRLDRKACKGEDAKHQQDQDQQRHAADIDPGEQTGDKAVMALQMRLADQLAQGKAEHHRQDFDHDQADEDCCRDRKGRAFRCEKEVHRRY
jgi:hypothetical protein